MTTRKRRTEKKQELGFAEAELRLEGGKTVRARVLAEKHVGWGDQWVSVVLEDGAPAPTAEFLLDLEGMGFTIHDAFDVLGR